MELTDRERLFVAQAIMKVVGEQTSTKEPGNLRSQVDEDYYEKYREDGAKSFSARIGDTKVGTYSIRESKPVPEDEYTRIEVDDPASLLPWVAKVDPELMAKYAMLKSSDFANWYFAQTGEVPAGCNAMHVHTEAQPARYSGGSLNIEPELVAQALGAQLPHAVSLMLGGGQDD